MVHPSSLGKKLFLLSLPVRKKNKLCSAFDLLRQESGNWLNPEYRIESKAL
jgi:hypothetical protein